MEDKKKIRLLTALFWILLFLINYGHGAGWSGVYSVLIKETGSNALSRFFLFSALGGFALNICLMFFADVFSNEKMVRFSFLGFVCILEANLLVLASETSFSAETYKILLIFLAVLIIAVPSVYIIQTWNLINKTFSPKSAASVYPVLATASLIGSIAGGATANRLPYHLPAEMLIRVWAVSIFTGFLLTFPLKRLIPERNPETPDCGEHPSEREKENLLQNFANGWRYFRSSSFAKHLGGIFMSFWLLCTIIDFCYGKMLDRTYASAEEIASFTGAYTTAANIAALLIQTFVGAKLLKVTGVRNGFLFLPLSQMLCLAFMIASPGLAPVAATMFMQTLVGMSVQSNSIQVSFNIFQESVRGKVRTLLEGVINPLGGVIASLIILGVERERSRLNMPVEEILPYIGVIFAGLWVSFALNIRKSYFREIRRTYAQGSERDKKDALEALEIERKAKLR